MDIEETILLLAVTAVAAAAQDRITNVRLRQPYVSGDTQSWMNCLTMMLRTCFS